MNKYVYVGLMMAFVAAAFVPPSEAFFRDPAARKAYPPSLLQTFLGSAGVPLPESDIQVSFEDMKAGAAKLTERTLENGTQILGSVASIHSWKDIVGLASNPELEKGFETVETAVKNIDVSACAKMNADTLKSIASKDGLRAPTKAEFAAYCVARVMHLKSSCDKIAESLAIPLKQLCQKEA